MKAYVRPRAAGKTRELIKLAAEEGLVIVCANQEMVRLVTERAKGMGLDIPQPISWRQFATGMHRGRRIEGFAFDDVELGLQQMAGPIPVVAVSMTGSVKEPAPLPV